MNLRDACHVLTSITGVSSFYLSPVIMFALSNRAPEIITVVEERSPNRNVQVYLDMSPPFEGVTSEKPTPVSAPSVPSSPSVSALVPLPPKVIEHISPPISVHEGSATKKTKRRRNRYQRCKDNVGIILSDGGYHVNRDVIDYYAHLTRYSELGWAGWHKGVGGDRDGFKVRKINCDLHEAGIRNGDIIHSVNGRVVTTIPQGIRTWRKIRKKRRIILNITRRGKPMTLTYRLKR